MEKEKKTWINIIHNHEYKKPKKKLYSNPKQKRVGDHMWLGKLGSSCYICDNRHVPIVIVLHIVLNHHRGREFR